MTTKQNRMLTFSVMAGGLVVIAIVFLFGPKSLPCKDALPGKHEMHTIDDLILKVRNGESLPPLIKTAGFVLFKYKCPPCPEGAQCKPCMPNNMVVGSKPQDAKDYSAVLGDQQLTVYMDDPTPFADQMRYLFLLKDAKVSTTGLVQTQFADCALSP